MKKKIKKQSSKNSKVNPDSKSNISQDSQRSEKVLREILKQSLLDNTSKIFEGYNKAFTDAIKSSGIKNSKKIAKEFSKKFSAKIKSRKKEIDKKIETAFKRATADTLAECKISGIKIPIPPKSLIEYTIGYSSSNKQTVQKILEMLPSLADRILNQLNTSTETKVSEEGKDLIKRLENCEKGKDWQEYEDIGRDILTYCLVPPLLEPISQPKTHDGKHKRDFIFHVPLDISGFWQVFLLKFGPAIVVECKNYSEELDENIVLITSKYLDIDKLTPFGLILTRIGTNDSGKKGQRGRWAWPHKELIICLNDKDLITMIKLKDAGLSPWAVIDKAIRDFLQSL